MVRWSDHRYPEEYFQWNPGLFEHYRKEFHPGRWGELGQLTERPYVPELPQAFYFSPQRVTRDDVVLASNSYTVPEMRLLGMNDWVVLVPGLKDEYSDFQWRYDRLNQTVLSSIEDKTLDLDSARSCINYLRPYNADGSKAPNHFYYGVDRKTGEEIPADKVPVNGSISISDLKSLRIQSLYGMYVDEWVEIDFAEVLRALDQA